MTVMTIQSAGARRIIDSDPGQAAEAMASAEAAGHRGLTEMRRLLGMLRTSDPKTTAPLPGLGSLDGLVEQMELAGLPTSFEITGEARELPLGVDLNAYRIIQEALTNTLKHGGPNVAAAVSVRFNKDVLQVEVSDDGRGAAAETGTDGQGLLGMQERVTLLKGSMHAGPRPGGGFRVAAKIPIPA
jgi:signal transduction histidine kinase